MKKKDLNPSIKLEDRNIKSKSTEDIHFIHWNLPAVKTCPYSTEMCRKRCFAKKYENGYNLRINNRRELNFQESLKDTFVQDMINYLEWYLDKPKVKNKKIFTRIHTSGDFYNLDYFKKWVEIANHFSSSDKIIFQAYTKSMPILLDYIKWWQEDADAIWEESEYYYILGTINIHLVWSVWNDTPIEYTHMAENLQMQKFTALPKDEIALAVNEGDFLCSGDCGNCKECYTGNSLNIVIPYH